MTQLSAVSVLPIRIPAPGSLVTYDQMAAAEAQIAAELPEMHDVGTILDTRDRIAALEQYLRGKQMHRPALGALRRLEARVGQLLGEAKNGGDRRHNHRDDCDRVNHSQDRADFRIIARALNGDCALDDDEWRQSRRALVALVKGRTQVEPAVKMPNDVLTRQRTPINVPAGMTPEDVARKGLASEADGVPPETIAQSLGIGIVTYRKMRDIVVLADRDDLSVSDMDLAKTALRTLNGTFGVAYSWPIVESLASRLWGAGRNGLRRTDAERVRLKQFEHGFSLVLQACETAASFDVPYLNADRVAEATRQLDEATRNLAALKRRIAEVRA